MHFGIRWFVLVFAWLGTGRAFEVRVTTYFESGERSRSYGGGLSLALPFDDWAAGSRRAVSDPLGEPHLLGLAQDARDPRPAEAGTAEPRSSEAAETTNDSARSSVPRRGNGSVRPPEGVEPTELEERRVPRLSSGFLRALVDAALLQHAATGRRLDALDGRARTSAWLPELRLRAGRNIDETLRLTPTIDDPDRWQLTGGSDLRLEAQLGWRLNRLVFAGDELGVERLRAHVEQRRTRLVETVLDWVFRWQKAALRSDDPALDDAVRLEAVLAMAQAESALDVLSAGWFSRRLPAELLRQRSQ